jgi:hypothetical protein
MGTKTHLSDGDLALKAFGEATVEHAREVGAARCQYGLTAAIRSALMSDE